MKIERDGLNLIMYMKSERERENGLNIACHYITLIPRGMPTWTTILQNVKNNHIYNWKGKFLI